MNALSPVQADAYRLVHQDLYRHLDEAEFLAAKYDEWSEEDSQTARELIPDLITVIRGLVVMHEPPQGGHGMCRTCAAMWPCRAIETIHGLLKDPDRQFVKLASRNDYD